MMTDRRVGIIHCRRTMHKRGRTERRFAGITEIDVGAKIAIKFLRETEREFVEEIVRVLPVVQRLAIPRFAALKQERITAPSFSERIEAHHQSRTELRRVAERM